MSDNDSVLAVNPDPCAIAWFAGLYEGEGNVHTRSRGAQITIGSTDRDVLEKCIPVMGGRVTGPLLRPDRKPFWVWRLSTWTSVARTARLMLPYLGARRRQALEKLLAQLPDGFRSPKYREDWCQWVIPSMAGYARHKSRNEAVCDNCLASRKLYNCAWFKKNREHRLAYKTAQYAKEMTVISEEKLTLRRARMAANARRFRLSHIA